MKLFLILFFSFTAMASNWMPVSKIESQSIQAFQLESECKKSGEQCLDIGDEPAMLSSGFISLENDWGPESEEEACEGESECQIALASKVCPGALQKFISANYSKVYCIELLGKKSVKDLVGFSGYKAGLAAKAQIEAGIQMAQKLRVCGERVMALMLVRNQPKGLSSAQVKQLVQGYSEIKSLLESGSLVSAKEEIQAVVADGILVTEADKAALSQELDKCLGI